jgi:Big-like domain-containing protein
LSVRLRIRARLGTGPVLVSLLAACLSASDEGGGLRLDVAPIPRLIRGDSARVHAQLLGEDGAPISNARFAYSSTDSSVAVVAADGLVIAVSPGAADIRVQSIGTERTPVAESQVTVSASVSVDSLRPVAARWGQLLSLYGSGLGPGTDQVVTINGVPVTVESYQPADSMHPERFGVLQVVAAPPLKTGGTNVSASVLVTTAHGAAALSTQLAIDSVDVYWPNTLTPADLGTITSRRELPGLALEAPYWTDWFSFSTATAGDWTIKVSGQGFTFFPTGNVEAEQLDGPSGSATSAFIAYYPGTGSATGSFTLCNGRGVWQSFFFLPDPISGGFTGSLADPFTLHNVPAGRHDLIVSLRLTDGRAPNDASPSRAGTDLPVPSRRANEWAVLARPLDQPEPALRYDLVIEPGTGSDIAADAYEPNDFCEDVTSPLLTLGSSGFTDSVVNLSFEGPGDVDWFKVVAQTGGLLQIRSPTGPNGELTPAGLDSAVVAASFNFLDPCTGENLTGVLGSDGPDGCALDGVRLESGAYYLTMGRDFSDQAEPYQLVVNWSPGALSARSRIAAGRR